MKRMSDYIIETMHKFLVNKKAATVKNDGEWRCILKVSTIKGVSPMTSIKCSSYSVSDDKTVIIETGDKHMKQNKLNFYAMNNADIKIKDTENNTVLQCMKMQNAEIVSDDGTNKVISMKFIDIEE